MSVFGGWGVGLVRSCQIGRWLFVSQTVCPVECLTAGEEKGGNASITRRSEVMLSSRRGDTYPTDWKLLRASMAGFGDNLSSAYARGWDSNLLRFSPGPELGQEVDGG